MFKIEVAIDAIVGFVIIKCFSTVRKTLFRDGISTKFFDWRESLQFLSGKISLLGFCSAPN